MKVFIHYQVVVVALMVKQVDVMQQSRNNNYIRAPSNSNQLID